MRRWIGGAAGAAAAAAAGAAGGVFRAGPVAVPGEELRVRAGDAEAGRRPVFRRLGADLLEGRPATGMRAAMPGRDGKRARLPKSSSLSRGRAKLGPGVHRHPFEQVAGPLGADGAPGVFCCGLRIASMDGSVTDVPDEKPNGEFFETRPSNQSRDGRSRRSGGW